MEPKDLGLKIKNYRVSKGLTQQEFANLLFIAPQTVSKWERGMSYPDVYIYTPLARAALSQAQTLVLCYLPFTNIFVRTAVSG